MRHPFAPLNPFAWTPVVATLWPPGLASRFADWCSERYPPSPRARSDDRALALFLQSERLRAVATVPSIVEHDDTELSLIRPRMSQRGLAIRRAAVPLGDRDALAIDWSANGSP